MKRSPILAVLLSATLLAQQETIRVDVPVVFAPVTVTDTEGRYIDGLEAGDFELLDNGKPVPFEVNTPDRVTAPLALVVAIQANEDAQAALEKIQKSGSIIPALISGANGSVLVIGFGDEVTTVQGWTRDAGDVSRAFRALRTQWDPKARLLDAAAEGIRLLSERAPEERRVLLVISETKDRGSKSVLGEVAVQAQRAGVQIQGVTFSAYATAFTKKGGTQPDPRHSGGNILGIFSELGRLGKENTIEALTAATGGRSRGFTTQKGLEEELGHVGEEIHSQYLLSFTPASPKPGFHALTVRVKNRKDAQVRTKPGYWAGEAKPE